MSSIESLIQGAGIAPSALLGTELPACPPDGQPSDVLLQVGRDLKRCLEREAWQVLAPHLVFDPRQYRRVRLWRDEHGGPSRAGPRPRRFARGIRPRTILRATLSVL